MHLFGGLGTLSFISGFCILVYLTACKIIYSEYGIATRPLFFFGILAIILGTQLFIGGFLAELIARSSSDRNHYLIEKNI